MALSGRIGLSLVVAWIVVALLGPSFAPHGVGDVVNLDVFDPVSARFPLGTDYLGRDMLSRVLYGARYTVLIAFVATTIAAVSGILLGLAAAAGGWVDIALSRTFDIVIAIPSLMLALVVIAATGASIPVLIGTLAVIYTPGAFRTARALAMGVMALDFVLEPAVPRKVSPSVLIWVCSAALMVVPTSVRS